MANSHYVLATLPSKGTGSPSRSLQYLFHRAPRGANGISVNA